MTVSMSEELRRAVAAGSGEPVTVIDPETNSAYVLVSADEYVRLSGEQAVVDSYPLQEAVAHSAGWDDPAMDDYNDYDKHRVPKA